MTGQILTFQMYLSEDPREQNLIAYETVAAIQTLLESIRGGKTEGATLSYRGHPNGAWSLTEGDLDQAIGRPWTWRDVGMFVSLLDRYGRAQLGETERDQDSDWHPERDGDEFMAPEDAAELQRLLKLLSEA